MDLSHEAGHIAHGIKMWRLNMALAQMLKHHNLIEDGHFTFKSADSYYLRQIEFLHLSLFKEPMPEWLRWVYRFRLYELGSVIVNEEDRVIAYDLFMFNAGEYREHILHELYVGVDPEFQGQGLSTLLRQFSASMYNYGRLSAISTVASEYDIKALRSAQKSGFSITKRSLRPPGHYLLLNLVRRLDYEVPEPV